MMKNRGSQRGVVKLATSAALAGALMLLAMVGCSSDAAEGTQAESVGSVSQPLVCGTKTCTDFGPCVKATCDILIKNTCNYTDATELSSCRPASGGTGTCVTNPGAAHPVCCAGCFKQVGKGAYECVSSPDVGSCGAGGSECKNCDGGNTCEKYACKGGECLSAPLADGDPCSDESGACNAGECCTGCIDSKGVCQRGNTVSQCGVSTAKGGLVKCKSCDDANVCTGDSCVSGVCAAKTPVPGSCDDGNKCTTGDSCSGLSCTGDKVDCDDNNPCTDDSCDVVAGCIHTPVANGTDCNDGLFCTVVDKCSNGKCLGTGTPNCNDNNPCTSDSCDNTLARCVNNAVANNTPCDDGNACSTGDRCVSGKCTFVSGKDCNDDNVCTVDACESDVCKPINVEDGTSCLADRCHVNSECRGGKCEKGEPINCDDGNPCTEDSCDVNTGCKHVNLSGTRCDDNDGCTENDTCDAGKCGGTEKACTALDSCHLPGTCNPKTGNCDEPRKPDNAECETSSGADGICAKGVCEPIDIGGGGAGNETGEGGEGASTGGSSGGAGESSGHGGAGAEPTASAGDSSEPGKGGTGQNAAGSPEVPEHVFVRKPGGCSCSVPTSSSSTELAWLAAAALAVAVRRRRRGEQAA